LWGFNEKKYGIDLTYSRILVFLFTFTLVIPPIRIGISHAETNNDLSEMSIEELMNLPIKSVGFFDISSDKAPGSIWILNEHDIKTTPSQSIAELLQLTIPAVNVSSHSIYGSLYASRGAPMFDNSSSQFMWDGMNLNSGGSLGVNSGLKLPLLGDIHQIEVSSGPSAVIHGNGALNGFVNLVPKSGSTNPGTYANVSYGFDDRMIKIETGHGLEYGSDKNFYIYAGMAGADGTSANDDLGYGQYGYENHGNSQGIGNDYNVREIAWPNYRTSLNWNHGQFQLTGLLQKELYSSNSYYTNDQKSPQLYHETAAIRPKVDINLGALESLEIDIPLEFFDSGYISNYKIQKERGNSDLRIETNCVLKSTRIQDNQLAAGFKIEYDHHRSNRYYLRSRPSSSPIGDDADWIVYSLFTEDIFSISKDWNLTAGIRYDSIKYDTDEASDFLNEIIEDSDLFSPRIATSYNLTQTTVIKAGYQEGFHFPPVTEIYTGNLKPESIKSFETNLIQELPGTGLKITCNAFYNIYKDSLLSDLGSTRGNQRDDFGATGGEIAIDWADGQITKAQLSYSYSRPLDISSNPVSINTADEDLDEWYCYPAHMIKGRIYRYWMEKMIMTSLAFEYGSSVSKPSEEWYQAREIFNNDRFSVSCMGKIKVADRIYIELLVKNVAHNNIPVPSYPYNSPWEGALGEASTYSYIGFKLE